MRRALAEPKRAAMEAERGRPPRTRPSPPSPVLLPLPRLRIPDAMRVAACVLSSVLDVPAQQGCSWVL